MPQILLEKPSDNLVIGVWEIAEPLDVLLAAVNLTAKEQTVMAGRKSMVRQQQFVAARILLSNLTGEENSISYNNDGKPVLAGETGEISISHSGNFVAVSYSVTHNSGIDIECMPRQSLLKAREYFLNERELAEFGLNADLLTLHLAWSAKEAVFKAAGNSGTDSRNDIRLFPFVIEEMGSMRAEISRNGIEEKLEMYYKVDPKFVLVVTV